MDWGDLQLATPEALVLERVALPPLPTKAQSLAHLERIAASIKVPQLAKPPPLKKRKIGKFLYLPVEIKARELAGRAKLAGDMARRGWQVLIGASWNMMHRRYGDLPPGIVLFKTLNALDARGIFQAAQYGHITACLNEELVVMPDDERLYRLNCDSNALHLVDHVFAHSKSAARVLEKLAPRKVVVTGAPRRVERKAWNSDGDIIVCTQAGTINNALSYEQYVTALFTSIGKPPTGDFLEITRDQVSQEHDHYQTMIDIAKALHGRYGDRVKIRPHPAENHERYLVEGVPINRGNSFSEQLGKTAVVVFVSGCGTGLEAAVAEIPSVRIGTGGFGKSRDYGGLAEDVDGALKRVADIFSGHAHVDKAQEDIAPLTIADTLHSVWRNNHYPMPFDIEHAWRHSRAEVYSPDAFQHMKFPGTDASVISELAAFHVKQIDWNMWVLKP